MTAIESVWTDISRIWQSQADCFEECARRAGQIGYTANQNIYLGRAEYCRRQSDAAKSNATFFQNATLRKEIKP